MIEGAYQSSSMFFKCSGQYSHLHTHPEWTDSTRSFVILLWCIFEWYTTISSLMTLDKNWIDPINLIMTLSQEINYLKAEFWPRRGPNYYSHVSNENNLEMTSDQPLSVIEDDVPRRWTQDESKSRNLPL